VVANVYLIVGFPNLSFFYVFHSLLESYPMQVHAQKIWIIRLHYERTDHARRFSQRFMLILMMKWNLVLVIHVAASCKFSLVH